MLVLKTWVVDVQSEAMYKKYKDVRSKVHLL
jgi:hypothetical protein